MAGYPDDIQSYCRPETGRTLARYGTRCDDVAVGEIEPLFDARDGLVPPVLCIRGLVGLLAQNVRPEASRDYMEFLLGRMWGIHAELNAHPEGARQLGPDFMRDLHAVYGRVPYLGQNGSGRYPRMYFGCARAIGVDVRPLVDGKIAPHWDFGDDYLFSETWAHARYLASFDHPEVLEQIANYVRLFQDANTVLVFLQDLANHPVVSAGMRNLIAAYANDPRPTDNGIAGVPTIPLGQEVAGVLKRL